MSSKKSPGISRVTTNVLKNLPSKGFNLLTCLIRSYWQDRNCDFESWHINILSLLNKGKGDSRDLKNWWPICLRETTAKIINTIVAKRLLENLNTIGARTQFGHIGYQEALHSLRNLLITRRHQGKESYVLSPTYAWERKMLHQLCLQSLPRRQCFTYLFSFCYDGGNRLLHVSLPTWRQTNL